MSFRPDAIITGNPGRVNLTGLAREGEGIPLFGPRRGRFSAPRPPLGQRVLRATPSPGGDAGVAILRVEPDDPGPTMPADVPGRERTSHLVAHPDLGAEPAAEGDAGAGLAPAVLARAAGGRGRHRAFLGRVRAASAT